MIIAVSNDLFDNAAEKSPVQIEELRSNSYNFAETCVLFASCLRSIRIWKP
jgi:hypothetical protein